MGYAMFASRKLMLTNTINMLNLELTNVMNKKSDLTELGIAISDGNVSGTDLANCQQSGLAFEYGLELGTAGAGKVNDIEYYAGYADAEKMAREQVGLSWGANIAGGGAGAAAGAAAGFAIGNIPGAIIGGIIGLISGGIIGNKCSAKTKARDEFVENYNQGYVGNLTEEKQRELEERIALMENELDKKQKSLETKIQAYTKDLESTEKAEAKGIENSTPKYSGVQ